MARQPGPPGRIAVAAGPAHATDARGGRRAGWPREIAGVVISVAMVLVAYHQVAFGGRTFDTTQITVGVNGYDPPPGMARPKVHDMFRIDPGASAWQFLPWARVAHDQIIRGHIPLWNPYESSGAPLAANAQSAVFDPLMLAVHLHPTPLTWDLSILFAFMLAAAATYLFLRSLGITPLGAVAGSGAYTMAGYFAAVNNNSYARLYAYLPILLLAVELVITSPRIRWIILLGLGVAGSIVVGMPESTFLVIVAAGAYALFRLVRTARKGRILAAMRLLGGTLLGLGLASPFLLLFLQYLRLSFNGHDPGIGDRTATPSSLLYWLVPYVNRYDGAALPTGFRADGGWCGVAAATAALVGGTSLGLMRRFGGWFFVVLATIVLLKNHNIPGVRLIGKLPALNRIDFTTFAPPLVAFGVAVVAAIGIQALWAGSVQRRRLLGGAVVCTAPVAILLYANRSVLSGRFDSSTWRTSVVAPLAGAAVLGAAWLSSSRRPSEVLREVAAAVAAMALLLEMFLLFPQAQYAPRGDPYQQPSWLPLVTASTPQDTAARVFGLDRKLYPDIAGVYGLQDVRGVDGLFISRYVTYLKDFVFPRFADRLTGDEVDPPQFVGNPMFNLLGVRYVLTSADATDARVAMEKAGSYARVGAAGGVAVFQNLSRAPRAFVATSIHAVSGEREAIAYLKGLGHALPDGSMHFDISDPTHQAVVETGGRAIALPTLPAGTAATRSATITSYTPAEVDIDVPEGPAGLLVLTDAWFPGWDVTVDGRPAAVLATDVAFRGVVLGSGAARITFRYHPPAGTLLWAIPLLTAAGCVAAWVVLRFWPGRSGAGFGR